VSRATTALLERPLVLGASGMVGGAFFRHLRALGHAAHGTRFTRSGAGLEEFTLAGDVAGLLERVRPSLVILASALTFVDYCEVHPEETHERNVRQIEPLVEWCRARDVPLLFFSTDYVFDGTAGPYDEDAAPAPLNVYGRSKLEGERLVASVPRHAVLRVTNVFDAGDDDKSFVSRCIAHLREGRPLTVPTDQTATPTYAPWLAAHTTILIARGVLLTGGEPRTLHVACDEAVSRLTFARRVAELLGADAGLIGGRPTSELDQPARRPLQGGLRNDRLKKLLGLQKLPLEDALRDALPGYRRRYEARA
jgi:dTDP-4-dehydrorhamnose reductase